MTLEDVSPLITCPYMTVVTRGALQGKFVSTEEVLGRLSPSVHHVDMPNHTVSRLQLPVSLEKSHSLSDPFAISPLQSLNVPGSDILPLREPGATCCSCDAETPVCRRNSE